jgi:formylglycine-generating enzyme
MKKASQDPTTAPRRAPARHMVWVPGGTFLMGSDDFYPEERPAHPVEVDGFWMDDHPVTVAEFRRFVRDTGHVTWAEHAPLAADYPDADPDLLVPGSLVFQGAAGPVDLSDISNWWAWTPGAQWRHPEGPGSTVDGRDMHPVTHVAYSDAVAFAAWAGKRLPTEAQWERAARGGLEGKVFCWGDEFSPRGRMMANTWQGQFPWQNLMLDGFERTSPVKRFPANGYGLYDMAGNIWEWTSDQFTPDHGDQVGQSCCGPVDPRRSSHEQRGGPTDEASPTERRVTKGGSHLCAPNYCLRYRPAARQGQSVDTSTGHIGFRCIVV